MGSLLAPIYLRLTQCSLWYPALLAEKMLRRQLESHFGVGLTEKKTLLRTEIEAYLQSHNAPEEGGAEDEGEEEEEDGSEEEDEEDDGDAAPVKKRSRGGATRFGDVLSEPMSAFLGMERCPRTQVVKKMWEYIKANNLQDPKDKRRVLLDDKMKTIFPGKSINMFTMQKHLSKHVFIDGAWMHDDFHVTEGAIVLVPSAGLCGIKSRTASLTSIVSLHRRLGRVGRRQRRG